MQENRVTVSPVLLNRMGGGLYHRLGALPTPTRVRAVVRGGCAVLGVPRPLLSVAEVEDIHQHTCAQVSAPEDADAFPNSLCSIQSPSLPSRLLLRPTPSIALCMVLFCIPEYFEMPGERWILPPPHASLAPRLSAWPWAPWRGHREPEVPRTGGRAMPPLPTRDPNPLSLATARGL